MKAISIKQPYAYLIASGIKDIENRTWTTKYRGRVYIHATKNITYEVGYHLSNKQLDYIKSLINFELITYTSAIIGEVDIVDCVVNHSSIWAEKTRVWSWLQGKKMDNIKPIYNWVLSNPILYDEPILGVKGKLSFWEFNENIKQPFS